MRGILTGLIRPKSAAGGTFTVSFRSSSVANNTTNITSPSDVVAGDLMILWDRALNASGVEPNVIPAGFTQISTQSLNSSNDVRVTLSYKIAVVGDGNKAFTGMGPASNMKKMMHVYKATAPIATVTIQDNENTITNGNPAAQVKNATSFTAPLVVFAGYHGANLPEAGAEFNGATPDESLTVVTDDQWTRSMAQNPGEEVDITVDMIDEGILNCLASVVLEIGE